MSSRVWSPEQTPDHFSKNETARQLGISAGAVESRLGEPDSVFRAGGSIVKLYSKQRVFDHLADREGK